MRQSSYNIESASVTGLDEPEDSKKPDNTAFKQQRLPAWQPILTPKSVLPTFFIISFIFIPIGAVLFTTSDGVREDFVDYTHCTNSLVPNETCASLRENRTRMNEPCTCVVNITLNTPMTGNIYMYYGLNNFFQNHRRYVKSRDDNQLVGTHVTNTSISKDCTPYRTDTVNGYQAPIAPCGAIANSFFNDSFTLQQEDGNTVNYLTTGISWYTDHTVKFNNPFPSNNLTAAFSTYTKPKFWNRYVQDLDTSNINNNGYKNEALEVWMRTAAFPKFRKLYGRLVNTNLPSGTYSLKINYNYPVTAFGGRKRFIISTTSWMGGKNNFLGIAYIVVGCCSFVVGVALCIIHFITRHKNVE
nr:cell cycle control protein 50A [Ciona intestinalis]|eukprot:XP_018672927.1 cell cycle control protein 50A [Ciona intestinalis]